MLKLVEAIEYVEELDLANEEESEELTIEQKLQAIVDMKERMKYYLDEIELYLPMRGYNA